MGQRHLDDGAAAHVGREEPHALREHRLGNLGLRLGERRPFDPPELALRRQNVRFVLMSPDAVCQQLVGSYTDIKQRQLI